VRRRGRAGVGAVRGVRDRNGDEDGNGNGRGLGVRRHGRSILGQVQRAHADVVSPRLRGITGRNEAHSRSVQVFVASQSGVYIGIPLGEGHCLCEYSSNGALLALLYYICVRGRQT
jgi:hypothetical protein